MRRIAQRLAERAGGRESDWRRTRVLVSQNQITAMTGFTTSTYDNNGNMKNDEAGNVYTYDAWNRMVTAAGGSETYSHDADNRRPGLSICLGTITNSYYDVNWQDLEDDVYNPCGGSTTVSTYEWGLSYIDDLIERDQNVNGGAITRIYAQQDANHDVTALVNTSGTVLERFIYDPYGSMKVLNASTWATRSDGYSWVYTFQGGRYDSVSGKINFRNRDLDPVTGTWMEQDPSGYGDGANLYQFLRGAPGTHVDPMGRRCCTVSVVASDAFGLGRFSHLTLLVDEGRTDENPTAFELLKYYDAPDQDRIGSGPAGLLGIPSGLASGSSEGPTLKKLGASGRHAYGIFMIPDAEPEGTLGSSRVLPPGSESKCWFADSIIAGALLVAGSWTRHNVAYDFVHTNSNTYVGQVIRSAAGTVEDPSVLANAVGFYN